jgi:uncharacterized membrane protein YfcA
VPPSLPPFDGLHLAAVAVFVVAGLVKGVVGLGLPTVAMALLALGRTPAEAAVLLIVPSLVTNVWQMRPWSTLPVMLRRLAPMQAGLVLGTLAGAWWLGAPAGPWATISLGVALVAYAGWSVAGARPRVRPDTTRWLGPAAGVVTGVVTAATGVFVVPAVPYLQALGLDRDGLLQAMGLSFTVSTVALAVGLVCNGSGSPSDFGASLLMLVPALVGMRAGQAIGGRLSPTWFRLCFFGSLAALGIHMVVRSTLAAP